MSTGIDPDSDRRYVTQYCEVCEDETEWDDGPHGLCHECFSCHPIDLEPPVGYLEREQKKVTYIYRDYLDKDRIGEELRRNWTFEDTKSDNIALFHMASAEWMFRMEKLFAHWEDDTHYNGMLFSEYIYSATAALDRYEYLASDKRSEVDFYQNSKKRHFLAWVAAYSAIALKNVVGAEGLEPSRRQ